MAALVTPLLPFIRDSLSLDYTKAGLLVSAFNLAYGFSQLPGGWLSDRAGSSKLVAAGISGVAISGFLVGFSSTFTMMTVLLVLMGVFGGGYHPSSSSLISVSVDKKFRGRALGIHQLGGTASFFLAPLVAVGIANIFGWRGSFLILSAPIFVFGLILFLLLRSWGYNRTGGNNNGGHSITGPRENSYGKSTTEDKPHIHHGRFHSQRAHPFPGLLQLVPVIILNSAVQMFMFSTVSFIPFYVVDRFGGSKRAAASMLSLAHLAGFWAGPSGGYLSDRVGKIPVMLVIGVISGPLIYLLNYVFMGWSIYLILFLMGMAAYMTMPVTEAFIINRSPEQNRSTFLGVYYFVGRSGMGLIAPAIGFAIDRYGFGPAFTFFALTLAVIVIVCAAAIFIKKDLK